MRYYTLRREDKGTDWDWGLRIGHVKHWLTDILIIFECLFAMLWHNIISDVFLLEAVSTGPVSMGHCLSGWGLRLAFIVMLPAPATGYPGKCRNTGALRNAWRTLQHIKGVLSNPAHKILWPRIWKCIPYNNATLRYINFIKRADSKREIEWLVQPENETR